MISVPRPSVKFPENIDPHWLAVFTSGEGYFFLRGMYSDDIFNGTSKVGFVVSLRFKITQHTRDSELMKSIFSFFVASPLPPPLHKWKCVYTLQLWMGEGCSFAKISNQQPANQRTSGGMSLSLSEREIRLCGNFYFRTKKNLDAGCYFIVTKYPDITEKIIPFFVKYPIVGVKSLYFNDFCEAASLKIYRY